MFEEIKYFIVTLLIFLRVAPLFVLNALPILSYIPTRFKVSLILVFSMVISLVLFNDEGIELRRVEAVSVSGLLKMAVGEILTGYSISLPFYLVAFLLSVSGKFWDYAHGFATLNAFNPGQDELVSIYGKVFLVIFTLLFFSLDFHHDLIALFVLSFNEVSLGSGFFGVDYFDYLRNMSVASGTILAMSLPVVFILIIFDFLSAYLVRSNPGFNVYFITLPAKVLIGMIVFHYSIEYLMESIAYLLRVLFKG